MSKSKSYWMVVCRDAADAAVSRKNVFELHVAYVKNSPLKIILAGPLFEGDSPSGSMLLLEDAPRHAVDEFLGAAPFAVAGVWQEVRVERLTPAISRIET